ncbi:hypothetical protein [Clostridium chrysemydis]|uniref:hypothetical protein n=1 Tax=Clostridium chrysemydis TaxID=2665504 RepID=UPI00188481EA|nr:hypothetical protein [Clostridium chrysemydis]
MINIKETDKMLQQLNQHYQKSLKVYENTSNMIAFTTSIFISNLLHNIEFVQEIKPDIKNIRYIYSILRVTTEQVIIYKFLMRKNVDNEILCRDFLGANIDIQRIENSNETEFELLKLLGGKRTKLYENIFKQMAA